jgi:hypothetical protein
MIKIIIKALFYLLPLLTFAQTQIKTTVAVNANYHNRSCVGGVGFCSDSSEIIVSKTTNATLEKKSKNEILFAFDVAQLSKEALETLLSEKKFSVSGEKSISLDKKLLTKLEIDSLFSEITTGNYPLEIKGDKVYVTFTLTKK